MSVNLTPQEFEYDFNIKGGRIIRQLEITESTQRTPAKAGGRFQAYFKDNPQASSNTVQSPISTLPDSISFLTICKEYRYRK